MVSRQLPTQQLGLAGQPAYCRLDALQRLQLAAQPAILPVQPTGLPVQGTDFPAQRLDRVLLLPRPFQRLALPGARPGRRSLCRSFRPAKRRDLPAQRHELVLLLLRALQRLAQPGVLSRQRADRVLAGLRRRRGLGRLVLLSRRRGGRILPGLRRLQGFAQPEDFHAQRHDRAALARIDAGLRKELLQPRHFRLVEQRVLRRAADFLRLLDGRLQFVPVLVELRLQGTRTGTGIHLRPAQPLRARRRRHRRRPETVPRLDWRQGRPEILVAHRHARDNSESRAALPVSCIGCPK